MDTSPRTDLRTSLLDFLGCFCQWSTEDAEIKVPSFEKPELTNVLPLKPGSRSEYSHACFAYCQ